MTAHCLFAELFRSSDDTGLFQGNFRRRVGLPREYLKKVYVTAE